MVFVNNLLQKEIVNVIFYVFYVNKDLVKELLFGVNIVVMVDMLNNINNGLLKIKPVHMDVNINVSDLKILIDFIHIFIIFKS